jgi:hypothetical protein
MAAGKRRAAREAEARFKPPLAGVFLTVAGRTSAGPGPGHKRLPPGQAAVPARPWVVTGFAAAGAAALVSAGLPAAGTALRST